MKAFKYLGMMLACVAVAFSLNSCGLLAGGVDDIGISEMTDNGTEVSWSFNELIYVATVHYGYDSQENITYHKVEHKFGSSILAKAAYEEMTDEDKAMYEEFRLSGKVIYITFSAEEFEGLTKSDVVATYNEMKEMFDYESYQ